MQDGLIELNLGKETRRGRGHAALAETLDRAIALVADVAVGHESLKTTPELRRQLAELRQALQQGDAGDRSVHALAGTCLAACEDFFSRAREHSLNREIEFIEIIDVLRVTVRTLAGDSETFHKGLIGSSERFSRLLEIDDLPALKRMIQAEAQELNRLVEEKQKKEREGYARLSGRIETLQRRLDRAEGDAMLDPLTRVANRGSFDEILRSWVETYADGSSPFVLAMADLDDFKQINDRYGHLIGDRVLVGAVQTFGSSIRNGDVVARYGGDEFVLLLRNCNLEKAESRLTEIVSRMASTRYEYESGDANSYVRFTASCGLAEFAGAETAEDVIRRSDEALYEAKKRGKNRVVAKKKSLLRQLFGTKRLTAA